MLVLMGHNALADATVSKGCCNSEQRLLQQ